MGDIADDLIEDSLDLLNDHRMGHIRFPTDNCPYCDEEDKRAICPVHGCELHPLMTRYGQRWSCSELDCSVVWWGASNTTPADYDTREARKVAHRAFDRLWKDGGMTRGEAYAWLQQTFGLSPEKAHIGLFDKEQCERVVRDVKILAV